jgi:hypothetical protein
LLGHLDDAVHGYDQGRNDLPHPELRTGLKALRSKLRASTARKLGCLLWWLLTREEDYAYAQPSLTKEKLRRLEPQAGAERGKVAPGLWAVPSATPKFGRITKTTRGSKLNRGAELTLSPPLMDRLNGVEVLLRHRLLPTGRRLRVLPHVP